MSMYTSQEMFVFIHGKRVSAAVYWYTTPMKPRDLDPAEFGWEIDGTGYLSDHVETTHRVNAQQSMPQMPDKPTNTRAFAN